jgi:hypothetical protein
MAVGRGRNNRRSAALRIVYGERPIKHRGGPIWEVPSETKLLDYAVNVDRRTCECPYFRDRRDTCKHIEALLIYHRHVIINTDAPTSIPSVHKNAPYYDRLKEQEADILAQLLKSLGAQLNRLKAARVA